MTDSQTVPGDPTWTDLLVPSREVPLGGLRGIQVNRTLPHRAPPTVGAWCFVDCFGPACRPMQVLPHPHTGLQAVTLPLRGHIRHKDSLGNDVVLKPGEVNLMTAGDGVAHSEFSLGEEPLHGVQLWVALPDERRTGAADFEHHVDLPVVGSPNLTTMVFMGELAAVTSPVTTYTPLVGADLELCAGKATLGLNRNFEHAIMVLEGQAKVNSLRLPAAQMLYLRPGREWINLSAEADTRLLLLGGEPFAEELVMWWNFIGRTHEEIVAAREDWEAGSERFGRVDGHDDQPIPAPPMPQVRIKPRRRRHDAIVSRSGIPSTFRIPLVSEMPQRRRPREKAGCRMSKFKNKVARTSAEKAADVILRGVEKNKARVLIGLDARVLDAIVRLTGSGYQRIFAAIGNRVLK